MSSRAIVLLGVWILAMVLLGTMTVGFSLMFYIALTGFFAVVAAVLMLITRQRARRADNADATTAEDETGRSSGGTDTDRGRVWSALL